jgi:dCMP deaminase
MGATNMSSHYYFMRMAEVMAKESHDPSTKVGCIIVDQGNIVALGFNHIPRRIRFMENQIQDRSWKYSRVIHAELDAVLKLGKQIVKHPIMYSTHYPCDRCAALIVEAGIQELYTKKIPLDMIERWGESMKIASQILQDGNVFVNYLDGS